VNIREYYEKDGKELPGKKVPSSHLKTPEASANLGLQGISLTLEQYNDLLRAIPGISAALRKAGHQVDDLDADAVPPAPKDTAERKSKPKPKAQRSNIEQTSDEDES